jgi:beta-lactam-binding protein with PASTA domain
MRWQWAVLLATLAFAAAACTATTGPTRPPNTVGMTYPAATEALTRWCRDLDITANPGLPPTADPSLLYVSGQDYSPPVTATGYVAGPSAAAARQAFVGAAATSSSTGPATATTPAATPTTCAAGRHVVSLRLSTTVSPLEGLTVAQAQAVLAKQGLQLAPVTLRGSTLVVRSQTPLAGTQVAIDAVPFASQQVVVVLGVVVPDVTSSTETEACVAIGAADLKCAINPVGDGPPPGIVTDQKPAAKLIAAPGEVVTITVRREIIKITVPNVLGKPEDAACTTLKASGLVCDAPPQVAGAASGTVAGQSPQPGAQVLAGTRVTLQIRQAIIVPDLVGKAEDVACQALLGARLVCSRTIVQDGDAPGMVTAQNPPAGSTAAPGDPVVMEVRRRHKVRVPDVVGRSGEQACQPIQDARLVCLTDQGGDAGGDVVVQNPAAGSLADEGTEVTLTLSGDETGLAVPAWLIALALAVAVTAAAAGRRLTRRRAAGAGSVEVRLVPGAPQVRTDQTREW